MRKQEFFLILLFVPFLIPAYGEITKEASLWIPENMITGETYEGVAILDNASPSGHVIILSTSDPSIMSVPESVSILPYQNHGIFKIKALRQGSIQVFVVVDGKISVSHAVIHSSSVVPEALSVLFPANKTKANTMIGYVVSVDSKGTPAPVSKDTQVTLSASQMITVDKKIQIEQGSHYAKFVANIKGSGKVFANAPGLELGESQITKLQDEVTVKLKVAPDIILENSRAYFYVWLEKDGKPFKPPYVVHAFLSSNNLGSIRFNENTQIRQHSDAVLKISLTDGVGSGTLVSSEPGSATITANVEAFGSAQTNVVVGPVLVDENFEFLETEDADKIKEIENRKPNIAFVWVYPSITDSKAFGVVALYNMNSTKDTITSVKSNGTSVTITNSINRVMPVPIDGRTVTLTSSSGLDHPNVISLSESNEVLMKRGIGFNHAAEFQITGASQGDYILSLSGPGLERFQTKVQVMSPYVESYKINLTPIPSLPNYEQDIAMVSVFDGQNALIDAQKAFAGPVDLVVTTDFETKNLSIGGQNSAILAGNLNEDARVVISAAGITPHESTIVPSGIADSIKLDLPQRIHILEEAPYAIHEVDSNGVPLRKINFTNISATSGITLSNSRIIIDSVDVEDFAVLSRLGADSREIWAFANQMSLQITPHGTTNRVNRSFELRIDSDTRDPQIIIDSPIPYRKIDEYAYTVTPNREGHFNITFTGTKNGYAPAKSTYSVYAEKIFDVFFNAIGSDGKELHVNSLVKVDGMSKNFVTPHQSELRPQFVNAEFPATFEAGEDGYQLDHVKFGDQRLSSGTIEQVYVDGDTRIVAQYQRMIKIQAENAIGGGYYPYGATVTLSVPPKDKALFFVRDVFDHWEGAPYSADVVILIAKENMDVKAVLREDYSFLMLVFGIVMTAVIYFKFVWKKGVNLSWYVRKLAIIEKIPKMGSVKTILKKPKSKHKVLRPSDFDRKEIDF
ncbi:MAG: hypothetical protein ACT4NT_08310 [Nitrososphaerota archaeon]